MKTLRGVIVVALTVTAVSAIPAIAKAETAVAIFAGGCFWCVESDFDHVPGVLETVSGYTGGTTDNPTYQNHMKAKHREAVKITYDPAIVTYEQLLHGFWRSVDPTDDGGQFCDRGHSYTTAIYALDEMQLEAAQASKAELEMSGGLGVPIVTPIELAGDFWPAEDYHQNYYEENSFRYNFYRRSCGRDSQVENVWGEEAHQGTKVHLADGTH